MNCFFITEEDDYEVLKSKSFASKFVAEHSLPFAMGDAFKSGVSRQQHYMYKNVKLC